MLETQVQTAMHRLAVLLNVAPGALKEELGTLSPLPTAPAVVPVGMPSELLRRRPDIRQAERHLAASTARVGQAMADQFPKFTLTGAIAGQSGTFGSLLDSGSRMWSIGPGVSIPIFQGGRIRANIEAQNARQEQAAILYEQSILIALADVENGLVSFANEQLRGAALRESAVSSEKALALATERYTIGVEGFLNVLVAQLSVLSLQDQLVQSQSMVLTDLVSLYKALGGGWETDATVPVIAATDIAQPEAAPAP
jgi:NodT family efflux transporter outer membrane factor (OMF) lipoprotein